MYIDDVLHFGLGVLAIIIVILLVVPELAPMLVLGLSIYSFSVVAVDRTNREVKRMMNNALSPMMSVFTDVSRGRSVIQVNPSPLCSTSP